MKIENSAVLITGASSGIGEATALALASRRTRLALGARRVDRLAAIAERCRALGSPQVVVNKLDVTSRGEVQEFVQAAIDGLGQIDVLINNAGRGWKGKLAEMPVEEAEALIATNLMGTLWCTQAALPSMLAARSGVIINVASVVGFRAMPYSALYSASKHAVLGMSHALRGELKGSGIKISVVCPGITDTEFFQGIPPEGPLVNSADHVAKAIVRAIRWPRRDVIIAPYRLVHLLEPVWGGLLDGVMANFRRRTYPHLTRIEEVKLDSQDNPR
ncbi:MAG: SDR family NAD(P)-dependent oxidoreductase [Candidatus Dormibacteraceae bacterium]